MLNIYVCVWMLLTDRVIIGSASRHKAQRTSDPLSPFLGEKWNKEAFGNLLINSTAVSSSNHKCVGISPSVA